MFISELKRWRISSQFDPLERANLSHWTETDPVLKRCVIFRIPDFEKL
jgi:hypothetical protein